jgi:rsbT antagonist protein RsbS
VALHNRVAIQFKNDILDKIAETKVRGLVFDVSAIDVVDSFLVRQIGEIAMSAGIMGTAVVVVGLRPEVAMSLVEMGLSLEKIQTARDLEKGLEILRKSGKS